MEKKKMLLIAFCLNLVLVILHEMDAVFWKEWRIFGLTEDLFGMKVFILVHVPLLLLLFAGLLKLDVLFGKMVSLLFSAFLIVHFFLHYQALVQNYFNDTFSFGIIIGILIVSISQLIFTLLSFKNGEVVMTSQKEQ